MKFMFPLQESKKYLEAKLKGKKTKKFHLMKLNEVPFGIKVILFETLVFCWAFGFTLELEILYCKRNIIYFIIFKF